MEPEFKLEDKKIRNFYNIFYSFYFTQKWNLSFNLKKSFFFFNKSALHKKFWLQKFISFLKKVVCTFFKKPLAD